MSEGRTGREFVALLSEPAHALAVGCVRSCPHLGEWDPDTFYYSLDVRDPWDGGRRTLEYDEMVRIGWHERTLSWLLESALKVSVARGLLLVDVSLRVRQGPGRHNPLSLRSRKRLYDTLKPDLVAALDDTGAKANATRDSGFSQLAASCRTCVCGVCRVSRVEKTMHPSTMTAAWLEAKWRHTLLATDAQDAAESSIPGDDVEVHAGRKRRRVPRACSDRTKRRRLHAGAQGRKRDQVETNLRLLVWRAAVQDGHATLEATRWIVDGHVVCHTSFAVCVAVSVRTLRNILLRPGSVVPLDLSRAAARAASMVSSTTSSAQEPIGLFDARAWTRRRNGR